MRLSSTLEALYHNLADVLHWSGGTEGAFGTMALTFYYKFVEAARVNKMLHEAGYPWVYSAASYTVTLPTASFDIMTFDENQYEVGGVIVRVSLTNQTRVSTLVLGLGTGESEEDDDRLVVRSGVEISHDPLQGTLEDKYQVELTKRGCDKQIGAALNKFLETHQFMFE